MHGTSGHSCPNETGLNFFIFFFAVSSTHPFYACARVGPLIPVILARRRWRKRRQKRRRLFLKLLWSTVGEEKTSMSSIKSKRPQVSDASWPINSKMALKMSAPQWPSQRQSLSSEDNPIQTDGTASIQHSSSFSECWQFFLIPLYRLQSNL